MESPDPGVEPAVALTPTPMRMFPSSSLLSSAKKLGPPLRTPQRLMPPELPNTPLTNGGARRVPVDPKDKGSATKADGHHGRPPWRIGGLAQLAQKEEDALCQALTSGLRFGGARRVAGGGDTEGAAAAAAAASGKQEPAAASPSAEAKENEEEEARVHPWAIKREAGSGAPRGPALGRVQLLTPVRANKAQRSALGSATVLTPVRRSSRKAGDGAAGTANALLEISNFSYTPNAALELNVAKSNAAVNADAGTPTLAPATGKHGA